MQQMEKFQHQDHEIGRIFSFYQVNAQKWNVWNSTNCRSKSSKFNDWDVNGSGHSRQAQSKYHQVWEGFMATIAFSRSKRKLNTSHADFWLRRCDTRQSPIPYSMYNIFGQTHKDIIYHRYTCRASNSQQSTHSIYHNCTDSQFGWFAWTLELILYCVSNMQNIFNKPK